MKKRLGRVLDKGIVSCRRCGEPHDKRIVLGERDWGGRQFVTWASPVDGHVYERESAEEATLRWKPA